MEDLKSGGMLLIQVTMTSGQQRLLLVTPQQLQALQNSGQPTSGLLQTLQLQQAQMKRIV